MGKHKRSRGRESETTRQREVTDPLGWNGQRGTIRSFAIKRLDGKDSIFDSQFTQPEQWFVNETTEGVVTPVGIKRSQGQNVERTQQAPAARTQRTHNVVFHETRDAAISR